jgi:SpoVK/Ycf46/Vps4 family AAA+-type ATPase
LFVSGIANVTWAKDSFKELVLPQDVKDLLAAMVTSPRYWAGDSGTSTKRPGQFLLLHGAPGTGKSLAAEALAELAERPLYRISGSNIGTDATQIEQHFRSISHMCNKWDCVVLFDDADVFLESRSMQDLQRNAVFLTFLRCLDFFSGMVILMKLSYLAASSLSVSNPLMTKVVW